MIGKISYKMNIFFKSKKLILITTILGFCSAAYYIYDIPHQSQVVMQIKLAQIRIDSDVKDLEDYDLFNFYLKSPSSFTNKEVAACGLPSSQESTQTLINMLTLKPVKNSKSIVELKITTSLPKEFAIICGQSISENIQKHQNKIIQSYIKESKIDLQIHKLGIEEIRKSMSEKAKLGLMSEGTFFIHNDEQSFLIKDAIRLEKLIRTLEKSYIENIYPFRVVAKDLFLHKLTILLFGVVVGALVGFSISILRRFYFRLYPN